MTTWHLVTGEYPPHPGGVSDYTRLLARGLAATGDTVHIWTADRTAPPAVDPGVTLHSLPGNFGPRALALLSRELPQGYGGDRLVVQYVPHLYGHKAMNLPFCAWVFCQRSLPVWVMFHEVVYPLRWGQPVAHNVLALVNQLMARLLLGVARRVFVSIPAWKPLLHRIAPVRNPIVWLPVPSNLPTKADPDTLAEVLMELDLPVGTLLVGHFGTFGGLVTDLLEPVLVLLLEADPSRRLLLIGRGSSVYARRFTGRYHGLGPRVLATGEQSAERLAAYLVACDLMVQPYIDGVTTRRGSLMASLALGRPVITNLGVSSEPVWMAEPMVGLASSPDPNAIAATAEAILADPERRRQLGQQADTGYRQHFAIQHTVATLRRLAAEETHDH